MPQCSPVLSVGALLSGVRELAHYGPYGGASSALPVLRQIVKLRPEAGMVPVDVLNDIPISESEKTPTVVHPLSLSPSAAINGDS